MTSLEDVARAELTALEKKSLRRVCVPTTPLDEMRVKRAGRTLVNFSGNDYLGLAQDPAVKQAAQKAVAEFGAGAGASRLVTGDHPLYAELEAKIAQVKGTEDAVVFGSGYLANLGVVPVLVGRGDLVLADRLGHACLLDGAMLSGANFHRFRHNDTDHLATLLAHHRGEARRCLILTESVFSMDGDLAPLPTVMEIAHQHDAWVLVDDAHGLGVVGGGRGGGFAFDPPAVPDIQMGTLSKAAGSYGGYVTGPDVVMDWVRTQARSLIYSTGLPPAAVAAATTGLDIIHRDKDRAARPLMLARRFAEHLDLPVPESAIVPLVVGEAATTMELATRLEADGFLVIAIRPPTVPPNTARLRITFSAAHAEADVDALADAVKSLGVSFKSGNEANA